MVVEHYGLIEEPFGVTPDLRFLYRVSVKYYSKYNRKIFEEIHELNPSLVNPDYIQSGREIRIPSVKEDSGDEHPAAKQGSNTAAGRVEKP